MDPILGQVILFAGNFAPRGWALCDGQLLSIAQNTALFSILGTTYGGDGVTTFGLPDLRGRTPMHPGAGPGLSPRVAGELGGSETNTLLNSQLPSHNHALLASNEAGSASAPEGAVLGAISVRGQQANLYFNGSPNTQLSASAIAPTGNNQPVNNMMPFNCINYIIALEGIFPSRG